MSLLNDLLNIYEQLKQQELDQFEISCHPATVPLLTQKANGSLLNPVPPACTHLAGIPLRTFSTIPYGLVGLTNKSAELRWLQTGLLEPNTYQFFDIREKTVA